MIQILTCYKEQYQASKYDPQEHEACSLRRTHQDSIVAYSLARIAQPTSWWS